MKTVRQEIRDVIRSEAWWAVASKLGKEALRLIENEIVDDVGDCVLDIRQNIQLGIRAQRVDFNTIILYNKSNITKNVGAKYDTT